MTSREKFENAHKARYHGGVVRLRRAAMKGECASMTYRELLRHLRDMPDAVLDQRVQIFKDTGDHNKPVLMQPAYAFGTVEEMCHVDGECVRETRGPDFAHHPEQLILLVDGAPFNQKGDTWHTLEDGAMRGNVSGDLVPFCGRSAVTEPKSWETYGKLAYIRWRLDTASHKPSWDDASGEWDEMGPEAQGMWTGIAKSSALMAYPVLAGEAEA